MDDTDNTKISCQAVFILLCRHADPTKTETIHCTLFSGINKHTIVDKDTATYIYIMPLFIHFEFDIFNPLMETTVNRILKSCRTPSPSHSPKLPPSSERNFGKRKVGKSLMYVLTVVENAISIRDLFSVGLSNSLINIVFIFVSVQGRGQPKNISLIVSSIC